MSVHPSVCLSVCLSVTRWHCVKTTQARITKSSPTDSTRTLVFGVKNYLEIRKGSPRARALNESGVGKILNFQPISRRIQKRCKIGPKLLLMTNRKLHTPFRLVPKSTTLDYLERPIRILFQKDASFGAHHNKKPSCCQDGRPYCPIADDLCKSCGAFMQIGRAVFS